MSLTRDKKTIDVAVTSPSYASLLEEQGSRAVSKTESEKLKLLTAKQLINRWSKALGGLDRLQRVKTVYMSNATETGNVTGTVEKWTSSGGYREHNNLGGVHDTVKVFDGVQKKAWLRDQNGSVHELAGVDLEDEVTSAYLASFSYLIPGRMPGAVEYVGQDKERKHDLLKVSPEHGRAVTFYLEKNTGLPARQQRRVGDETVTTYFSDWRLVDGLRLPFQQRESTGDPKYDVTWKLQQVRVDAPFPELTFQRPEEAPRDFQFTSGGEAKDIPFELSNNHIYLQVQVNGGAARWFLLDTGAEITVVDKALAEAEKLSLHGPFRISGAGGSADVAWTKVQSVKVPGVSLTNQVVGVIALEGLRPVTGRRVDGILGYDFLSRFVVEIDYVNRLIKLHEASSYKYEGSGEILPITLVGSVPFLRTSIGQMGRSPIEGEFNIDTGSTGSLTLNTPFVKSHQLLKFTPRTVPVPLAGVGGSAEQRIGRIGELRLGSFIIKDPITGFSQSDEGDFASTNFAGVIGNEVLRRFDVVIDYSRKRLILSPNKNFGAPYNYDMSGALLIAQPPEFELFKVNRVIQDSPAAEAGLREGDSIVAIDGQPSSRYALADLRQMFKEEHREYTLSVSRAGEIRDVKIKLRKLI
jgi:predicted aspartyl protease